MAGYKKAGRPLISTEHRGTADGKPLDVFFTDVSVKADRPGYVDESGINEQAFKQFVADYESIMQQC